MFESGSFYAREIGPDELSRVQAFFEANPDYFYHTHGCAPDAHAAQVEFDDYPPASMKFGRRWFLGLFNRVPDMIGVAVVVSDLCAPRVWHIALFIIATRLHGSGAAQEIYASFEEWMRAAQARWIRLGVVEEHARALQFWTKQGFRCVRTRTGVATGSRVNDIAVLVKPLTSGRVSDYLTLVPRDDPGAP